MHNTVTSSHRNHPDYHYSSVVHVGVKGIIVEDSVFTCQRVLNYIDKTPGVRHTYDFTVGNRDIVVNYVDYDDKPRSVFDRYTKMIEARKWLIKGSCLVVLARGWF